MPQTPWQTGGRLAEQLPLAAVDLKARVAYDEYEEKENDPGRNAMRITRRRLLASVGALALVPTEILAQSAYPDRPIRLVVGAAPGGGTDVSARLVADLLGKELGVAVVVLNKPGGAAAMATDYVAKADPDGYTLMLSNADGATILPAVKDVPYDILKDFTYIARVLQAPEVLAVNANSPFKTLGDLIAFAKTNPGKLNCGTTGVGSASDLSAILLETRAGIKLTRVPYKGSGPVLVDLVGGQIDLSIPTLSGTLPYISSGKVRILAVTSDKRDPAVPDVPTTAEAGVAGFTVNLWFGILGPANLPAPIKDRLEKAVLAVLNTDNARSLYKTAGYDLDPAGSQVFKQAVAAEATMWKELARAENIVLKD